MVRSTANTTREPANGRLTLSYDDMQVAMNGSVLTHDQIRQYRLELGYCSTCRNDPVLLFEVRKSRFNPLMKSRSPRTEAGRALEGQCLVCNPELNPNYRVRRVSIPRHPPGSHGHGHSHGHARRHINGTTRALHSHPEATTRPSARHHPLPPPPPPPSNRSPPTAHASRRRSSTTTPPEQYRPAMDSNLYTDDDRMARRTMATDHHSSGATAAVTPPEDIELPPLEPEPENSTGPSADSNMTDHATAAVEDDPVERIFARCQRQSSMRNLRQSSIRNLRQNSISNLTEGRAFGRDPPGSQNSSSHQATVEIQAQQPASIPAAAAAPPPQSAPQQENDVNTVVTELESLIKDMSGVGDPTIIADVLVTAMNEYHDAIPVQRYCLGTIWDLCKDSDDYKASLISTSAPDDIMRAMQTHLQSTEVQERGCGALWSLAVRQDNRIILIRAGGPARIVKAIMEHVDDENVVRTGIGALRTLSPESEARESMGALQAIRHVCDAMVRHQGVACIQRDGCAFLSNSAVDLKAQTVAVASEFEMETIVKALSSHKTDSSVMAGACFALKNYTYDERNLQTLASVSKDLEGLLHHAATCSDDSACERDAGVVLDRLESLAAENDDLEQQAYNSMVDLVEKRSHSPGVVKQVLEIIQAYDQSSVIFGGGLQCLGSLATQDMHRAEITEEVLMRLVFAMNKFVASNTVQTNGCHLLETVASRDASMRQAIFKANGCQTLIKAMREHRNDVEVQIAITGVLRALSMDFDCIFELGGTDVSNSIIQEVMGSHPNSPTIQANATDILTNFSRYLVS